MTLQSLPGQGILWPQPIKGSMAATSSIVIDATGEKIAWSGRVWFPARTGTKDIERVQFRFGTVTKAGGSALTVSLQDVDAAAGPPMQPDGTQDQTVAIANADGSFASNTWYRTGTLSANRTVSCGDLLSVVVEYDGGGRLGADAVNFTHAGQFASPACMFVGQCVAALYTGSWAANTAVPCVVLEMSDGTFGTLDGAIPTASTAGATSFNSGSTPDEKALAFQIPFPCKIDALWVYIDVNASADVDIVLYEGTTVLETISVDSNAVYDANPHFLLLPLAAQRTLTVSTQYYLSVKPTTTNSVAVWSLIVNDDDFLELLDGSKNANFSSRTDAGSWAAVTTTERLIAGVRISSLDDGAGSGGGLIRHPGMNGGLSA